VAPESQPAGTWPVLVSLSHKDFIGETLNAGQVRARDDLARDLLATARVAWQVLAGAMPGGARGGEIHYQADPFGVFYLVAWMASQ
jgi:hypothetical protein